MRAFSLFTTDIRYSVPTFTLLLVENERQAIAQAEAALYASDRHRAVELHAEGGRIYRRTREDEAAAPRQSLMTLDGTDRKAESRSRT